MRQALAILTVMVTAPIIGCSMHPEQAELPSTDSEQTETRRTAEPSLRDLPTLWTPYEYKVELYLQAAWHLQKMGKDRACDMLSAFAKEKGSDERDSIIVLCRMLFTRKAGTEFRRPMIGGASFLGGTDYKDWPLEPIELVDGIPFLITRGYILGGVPESPTQYLKYCLKTCDWNPHSFASKSKAEKQAALEKLLSSEKWKRKLNEDEREFLASQIK